MWHLIAWLHWWDGIGAPVIVDPNPSRRLIVTMRAQSFRVTLNRQA